VLVENEQDTLGIIAYSLYKRQKIEFIQAFKTKQAKPQAHCDGYSPE